MSCCCSTIYRHGSLYLLLFLFLLHFSLNAGCKLYVFCLLCYTQQTHDNYTYTVMYDTIIYGYTIDTHLYILYLVYKNILYRSGKDDNGGCCCS